MANIVVWMVDKDGITTKQVVTQFESTETTAKRYLRQLTDFGYLEQHGGNRNRLYYLCLATRLIENIEIK